MARKEKLTLDYFPHYAVQGDISKIIQEWYGNDGYAVLYKNYEQFCLRDRQYIDLNEYVTLASISAYCKVSEDRYIEIVNTLVKLGAYDKELWKEAKILISEKFIENTEEVYRKRKSDILRFEDIKNFFRNKYTCKSISDNKNKQTKSNKIKEKVVVLSNEKTEIVLGNHQTTALNFNKPSFEEVAQYCKERNKGINPQKFFDYYEGSNWILGNGRPMGDWRAAIRTWERNEKKNICANNTNSKRPSCKIYKPEIVEVTEKDEQKAQEIISQLKIDLKKKNKKQ